MPVAVGPARPFNPRSQEPMLPPRLRFHSLILNSRGAAYLLLALTFGAVSGACATNPGKPVPHGKEDQAPVPIYQCGPVYPFDMRARGITGVVKVYFEVDALGNSHVLKTWGGAGPSMSQAAADAVAKWRFKPGILHGEAVATRMIVPINFSLSSSMDRSGKQVPIPLVQQQPVFPIEKRLRGVRAVVRVVFVVDVNGRCIVQGVEGRPDPLFATAAIEAVSKWKFQPGSIAGRPVAMRLVVPVVFEPNRDRIAKPAKVAPPTS